MVQMIAQCLMRDSHMPANLVRVVPARKGAQYPPLGLRERRDRGVTIQAFREGEDLPREVLDFGDEFLRPLVLSDLVREVNNQMLARARITE